MKNSGLTVDNLRTHQLGPYSLTISPGECVSLSGPSGSGKSLLLRAIADLDSHEGQVSLNNTLCETVPAPQWRKKVSLVPAESQWWHDTVGEHFTTAHCPYLEQLGFNQDTFEWQISRLSSGEKQRLGLARALMNEPKVLLLDEPTSSLDEQTTQLVEKLIARVQKDSGMAVLWVSHDTGQAARVGTRHYKLTPNQLTTINLLEKSE